MLSASAVVCGFSPLSHAKLLTTVSRAGLGECRWSGSVSSGMDTLLRILSHPSTKMEQRFCQESGLAVIKIAASLLMCKNKRNERKQKWQR
jgi:hypothetical protein